MAKRLVCRPSNLGTWQPIGIVDRVLVTNFKGDVAKSIQCVVSMILEPLVPPKTITSALKAEIFAIDVNGGETLKQTVTCELEPIVVSTKSEVIGNITLLGNSLNPGRYKIKLYAAGNTVDTTITPTQIDVYYTLK